MNLSIRKLLPVLALTSVAACGAPEESGDATSTTAAVSQAQEVLTETITRVKYAYEGTFEVKGERFRVEQQLVHRTENPASSVLWLTEEYMLDGTPRPYMGCGQVVSGTPDVQVEIRIIDASGRVVSQVADDRKSHGASFEQRNEGCVRAEPQIDLGREFRSSISIDAMPSFDVQGEAYSFIRNGYGADFGPNIVLLGTFRPEGEGRRETKKTLHTTETRSHTLSFDAGHFVFTAPAPTQEVFVVKAGQNSVFTELQKVELTLVP